MVTPVASLPAAAEKSLNLVLPQNGETIAAEKIRFAGHTDPAHTVRVNGQAFRVYPSGAFAGRVNLQVGENRIQFECRDSAGKLLGTAQRVVHRTAPLAPSPAAPAEIDWNHPYSPSGTIELPAGETLTFSFKGSPGLRAHARLGDAQRLLELRERDDGLAGVYHAEYRLQPGDCFRNAALTFLLSAPGAEQPLFESSVPDTTLTLLGERDSLRVRAARPALDLYAAPDFEQPIAEAPAGCVLPYQGRIGEAVRVGLGSALSGWARVKDVEILEAASAASAVASLRGLTLWEAGSAQPKNIEARLRGLTITQTPGRTMFTLQAGAPCAYAVQEHLEERTLKLRLYNCAWDSPPQPKVNGGEYLRSCRLLRAAEGVVLLELVWAGAPPTGFLLRQNGADAQLALIHPPQHAERGKALAHWKILLDPGHGGAAYGAIGATGLTEAEANHRIARRLAERLRRHGAEVQFTVNGPADFLELDQRVMLAEQAEQSDCRLFVSIHNDSVALSADPLAGRGSTVFYTHPHSRPLAQAVYAALRAIDTSDTPRGVVERDLRVTRKLTAMPAILAECRFISHPEDEMELLDDRWLERIARALAEGVLNYAASATVDE